MASQQLRGKVDWLSQRLLAVALSRPPDLIIGGRDDPYLLRWHLIPRNRLLNIYLHHFLRSDDDRALHDHPWANLSILIDGEYTEHTIAAGGIHHRRLLRAGDWRFRWSGRIAHRIDLHGGSAWTVFVTGPVYRRWGFHCRDKGWVRHDEFVSPDDPGQVGRGCD